MRTGPSAIKVSIDIMGTFTADEAELVRSTARSLTEMLISMIQATPIPERLHASVASSMALNLLATSCMNRYCSSREEAKDLADRIAVGVAAMLRAEQERFCPTPGHMAAN